jgi:hypothetical protein
MDAELECLIPSVRRAHGKNRPERAKYGSRPERKQADPVGRENTLRSPLAASR